MNDYGARVRSACLAAGLRVRLDDRSEKIGAKIREAQLAKIPFMLVVGDREAADGTVSVRSRTAGDQGSSSLDAFLETARAAVASRSQDV